MLFARKGEAALALASEPGPARQSVGYVGRSDGWQDFATNGRMTWTYETTEAGNVAGHDRAPCSPTASRALPWASGPGPRRPVWRPASALAGHFENAWDEYVAQLAGLPGDRDSTAAADVPAEDRDLYLDSAAVLRTHSRPHRAGRDRREPVDPVGQHAQ